MTTADLLITSARLWDGYALEDDAIAIADGRILARGNGRDISILADDETKILDVGGRRVIPGLIDSHIHLVRAGRTWGEEVRWEGLETLRSALEAIAQRAGMVEPGRWVGVVGGWHPRQFEEGRPPSRSELDEVAPDHPVFVQRNYVEAFANSLALEQLGWAEDKPDGHVVGPSDLAALRARIEADPSALVDNTRALLRELNRLGLTGAIDAAGFGMTAESYQAFFELFRSGERGFRARLLLGAARPGDEVSDFAHWVDTVSPGSGDDLVRYLGAGELLLYGAHDMEGLVPADLSTTVEPLADLSATLAAAGWPIHVHAILDTSVSTVLDAWSQIVPRSRLEELRFTICHADQAGAENLRRIRDMGLGITIQGGMAFRGVDSAATWDASQLGAGPNIRAMLDMGIPVGAGSDGTVAATYNPWQCISWMVEGTTVDGSPSRRPDQLLDIDEALSLYTSGSAWFSFEEETRGNLRPGSHADLAVLSADPITVPVGSLGSIAAVITVVGGEVVHLQPGEI